MSAERDAIVAEARSWLRTPWHHMARCKGAGVDCAQLLVAVYASVGLVPADIGTEYYPPDWHLHRDEPRFLAELRKYSDPVGAALPGDVAMFKYGRHAAHGAIVVEWPMIVHAFLAEGQVSLSDAQAHKGLEERFAGFWRLKGLA